MLGKQIEQTNQKCEIERSGEKSKDCNRKVQLAELERDYLNSHRFECQSLNEPLFKSRSFKLFYKESLSSVHFTEQDHYCQVPIKNTLELDIKFREMKIFNYYLKHIEWANPFLVVFLLKNDFVRLLILLIRRRVFAKDISYQRNVIDSLAKHGTFNGRPLPRSENLKFKDGLFRKIAREFYAISHFYLPPSVINKYRIFTCNGGKPQSKVRQPKNFMGSDKGKERDDDSQDEGYHTTDSGSYSQSKEESFDSQEDLSFEEEDEENDPFENFSDEEISEEETYSLIGKLKETVSRAFASVGFHLGQGAVKGATAEVKNNVNQAKKKLKANMRELDEEYAGGAIKTLMDFVLWIKKLIQSLIELIISLTGKLFSQIKNLCRKWKVFILALVSPLISWIQPLYRPLAQWFLGLMGFMKLKTSNFKDYNFYKPFSAVMDMCKMSQLLPKSVYYRLENAGHYMKDHFSMVVGIMNMLLEQFDLSAYRLTGKIDELKLVIEWYNNWMAGTSTEIIARMVANTDQISVMCTHIDFLSTLKIEGKLLPYRQAVANMLRVMRTVLNMLPAAAATRVKPLGICWGPKSGIGKSDILSEMTKMALLHVIHTDSELLAKYPKLDKSNIAYGTSIDDEYESGYFGQLYDFVDEMFLTRDDESLLQSAKEWISKINTVPRIAVKAEAELKGKIPYQPLLVNATTNLHFDRFAAIKVDSTALYRRTLYLDAVLEDKMAAEDYEEFQQSPYMTKNLLAKLDACYTVSMVFENRSEHFDSYLKLWKDKHGIAHNKEHLYHRKCRDMGMLRLKLSMSEIYSMIVMLIQDNIKIHRMKSVIREYCPSPAEFEELLGPIPVPLSLTSESGTPQSKMSLLYYLMVIDVSKNITFVRPTADKYEYAFQKLDGDLSEGYKVKGVLEKAFKAIEDDLVVRTDGRVRKGGDLLRDIASLNVLLGLEGLPDTIPSVQDYMNWCVKWRETFDFVFKSPVFQLLYSIVIEQCRKEQPDLVSLFTPEMFLGAIQTFHSNNNPEPYTVNFENNEFVLGYEGIPESELSYHNTTFKMEVDKGFVIQIAMLFIGFLVGYTSTSLILRVLKKFGIIEDANLGAEPQSYNKIYNQQQKAARLARTTTLMSNVSQGIAQSEELREHDYKVLSEFQRAIHSATFRYGEGYMGKAHIFNLFDHVFFAPYHNMRGRELQTLELTYGDSDNRKYIYRASDIKIIYENRDLEICIIKFINGSRLNRGKDLRKHFHSELSPDFESKRCVATLVEKTFKQFIFAEAVREYKTDFKLHGLDWSCTGWFTRYALRTEDSSCGLPYARKYGNKWFINGFQFCLSDNGNSMSTFVSKDLLDKLYQTHKYTPADTLGKFVPQSKLFKKVKDNIDYSKPVRDGWFPYNYIGTSKIKTYETAKSKYVNSIISESLVIPDEVQPAILERAYWKLPTGHVTSTDPYKKTKDSLRRCDCPPICEEYKELCTEHQDVLHKHQNRGLQRIRNRKLSDAEIIQGTKYVNGLRMDTSTGGFGVYHGIKKRTSLFDKESGEIINDEFRKAVYEQREYARRGVLICYPSLFSKKDETLSIEDVMPMSGAERISHSEYAQLLSEGKPIYPTELLSKMRLFMMSCIVTLYNLMYVNGVYNSYISHNLWGSMLVAYNPHGFEAEKIWMRLNQADNVILADHKGLDVSMPSLLLAEQIDFDAKQQGLVPYTEDYIEYVTLLSSVYLSPVQFRSQIFEPFNLHESGHGMTTPYNCNVTNQIVNTAVKCAYPDADVGAVDRIATGDDLVVMVPNSLSKNVNHLTLAGVSLLGFGLTMTTADKKNVTEPFFLGEDFNHVSRTWVEHENGRVVHALKKDSIVGMLHHVTKTLDPVQAIEQNIHAALLEAYKHGREYYDEVETAIHDSIIDTGIVVKIPNWEFLDKHFSKRFMPGNVIHGNFSREVFGLDVNYDINTFDFQDLIY